MSLFKSSNPVLSEKTFQGTIFEGIRDERQMMTVRGTMNKFGLLLLLMMGTAMYSWNSFYGGQDPLPMLLISVFGGLGVIIIMAFKKQWSPFLAPLYALLEGLFVGSISAMYEYRFETKYPGIVFQAVMITLVVAAVMFFVYRFQIIRVTNTFKRVLIIATASLALFYLITWVLFLFKIPAPAFLYEGSLLGIGFSIFVVALAALNLLLDFDFIEKGSEQGMPKYMEWFGATGLLVTLVWLYLEILRLLSKLNSRK
jgi:uncharacterized YccA/Bax inhibitor family protein